MAKSNGYVVLYGTSSGVYSSRIDVGDVTTIPVSGLAGSTKYFFAVQAYDESGALSEPSNEVAGTTPAGTSNPDTPVSGSRPTGPPLTGSLGSSGPIATLISRGYRPPVSPTDTAWRLERCMAKPPLVR